MSSFESFTFDRQASMPAVLVTGKHHYRELAISSIVVAETVASTHCSDLRRTARLSRPEESARVVDVVVAEW